MAITYFPVEKTEKPAFRRPAVKLSTWARVLIIVLGIVVYIIINYALAWIDAYRLSSRLMADADSSYNSGAYMQAFMGYEQRDPVSGKSITKGGYVDVLHVWSDAYSWPLPQSLLEKGKARLQDIMNNHMTIADAENFITAFSGLDNPYLGDVYLRLGELYQQSGDRATALSVYKDVADLFTDRPDIILQAQEHIKKLEANQP